MNTVLSRQNQGKESPTFDKKGENTMTSTIDRKRIFIFVAIAYGISIALGLALYFNGGVVVSSPYDYTRLAYVLMLGFMFAPTVANVATRLITREGWSNTLLRPNFRRGWRFYLAAWFLPVLAPILGGLIYFLLFPSRFDPSMTSLRETGAISKDMNGDGSFSGWNRVTFVEHINSQHIASETNCCWTSKSRTSAQERGCSTPASSSGLCPLRLPRWKV
jgi:hypothetical protein